MPFTRQPASAYDVVIVGSSFASSFFLMGALKHLPPNARVLVLERGGWTEHSQRVDAARTTTTTSGASTGGGGTGDGRYRTTGDPRKRWMFTVAFGGGSNCWWGNAPRFLPADFETRSRFGVGRDWPVGYDDLAPYYEQVEAAMSLAGPEGPWPYPRATPYAQPQHNFNDAERLLKAAYPDSFFAVPTARARVATEGRGTCCSNGVCHLCPVNAKFTIQNGLMSVYKDPRVDILLEAEVIGVETQGGIARGVRYLHAGAERTVRADVVALGANALFNPVILQRSGIQHPILGKGLHEQVGLVADVFLDGVNGFNGSTSVTGHSYAFYADEQRRRQMAACMIETWNVGRLRTERGKWQHVLPVRMVFDVLPDQANHVTFDPATPQRPLMHYAGHSDYTEKAIARAADDLARIMAPLPVERIELRPKTEDTEAHIIGTTPMGRDPATSIVDGDSRHHQFRNLLVLGSGTFPQGGPSNPSLTLSALALRASDRLLGAAA